MPFSDVVGHEQAIEVLRRAASSGRVAQAYLLVGPPNIGKTLVAKEFAKALNCETLGPDTPAEQLEPCGACHNCVRIEQENHPDLVVLRPGMKVETRDDLPDREDEEPEEEPVTQDGPGLFGGGARAEAGPNLFGEPSAPPPRTRHKSGKVGFYIELPDGEILKEAVEDLLRRASTTLSPGTRHRVLIIAEADRIRHDSVDRLLKTLEEPPAKTSFVLTTSNPANVKDTIVSRCQAVKFQPLSAAGMLAHLRERFPGEGEETLRAVTAMAGGRFGWALHLLGSPQARAVRDELLGTAARSAEALLMECMVMGEKVVDLNERWLAATDASLVGGGDGGEEGDRLAELRAKAVSELLGRSPDRFKRIAMNQLLDMLQSWYRDLALLRVAPDSGLVANSDWRERLSELAPQYSLAGIRFAHDTIDGARRDLLRHNANMRLACEMLMCKLIAGRRRR